MKKIKVLHITAHLGGGVGSVLSNVAIRRIKSGSNIEDSFVCLEQPEKNDTIDRMREAGVNIHICPDDVEIDSLIEFSDIVQIEWWHHPAVVRWMCSNDINARVVMWSHTSGLHYPIIPHQLVREPHRFLFTTQNEDVDGYTVNSCAGFDGVIPNRMIPERGKLSFGYVGSLNFSKLNPNILDFFKAVNVPNFKVDMFGDIESNYKLEKMIDMYGLSDTVRLRGFTDNPYEIFSNMDVMLYILNPTHYGTTENSLLEAMASGVVPIVLNNKVESSIVDHFYSGIVVESIESFASAVEYLCNETRELLRMSAGARDAIERKYSLDKTIALLDKHYRDVVDMDKRVIDFSYIFGDNPHEWFFSCLGRYRAFFSVCSDDTFRSQRLKSAVLYDKSKASVFQYASYFPEDKILSKWVKMLEEDLSHEG